MFPYTVTYYPPLPGARENIHYVVGKKDNAPDGHEDTLTIRFDYSRDNTLSIHMQCTDLSKIQTIREAFTARSSLTILLEPERGEYEPIHITHTPFRTYQGDEAIREHLNLMNDCVFNGKISELVMNTLYEITGTAELNPIPAIGAVSISSPHN